MANKDKTTADKMKALQDALVSIQKIKRITACVDKFDFKHYVREMKDINRKWDIKKVGKKNQGDIPDWLKPKEAKKPKKN